MKKICYLFVAAILMAVSCDQKVNPTYPEDKTPEVDAPENQTPSSVVEFVAYADEPTAVKSVIEGNKSYWDGVESIWVLDPREGNNDWKKEFSATVVKSETATFTEKDASTELSGKPVMAIYPASPASSASWSGNVADAVSGLWLANEQNAVSGTYDPSAHIAAAYTSTNELYFKNAVALLKFQVGSSDDFTEARFYTYDDTKITGNFKMTYNDGELTVVPDGNYMCSDVKLKGALIADTDYYMAILPADLKGGFAFEINGYKVKEMKTEQAAGEFAEKVNITRNTLLDLETLSLSFGICGSITGWADGADIAMTYDAESKMYVARNVVFNKGSETDGKKFKVRVNGVWMTELGSNGNLIANVPNDMAIGAGDCSIGDGTYDVWFDAVNKKLYPMTPGQAPDPNATPETPDVYSLVGGFYTGSLEEAPEFVYESEWYIFRDFTQTTDNAWLGVVKNHSWNGQLGGNWAGVNNKASLTGGSFNNIPAGTYDVYMNSDVTSIWFMEPGKTPDLDAGDIWSMTGGFNDWKIDPGLAYDLKKEGDWYVYSGFTLASEYAVQFVKNYSWAGQKGGTWSGLNTAIPLTGGDIKVPAGTYDVFLDAAIENAWFMTPGQTPSI